MILDNTEIMQREEKDFLDMIKNYVKEGSWETATTRQLLTAAAKNLNISNLTDLTKIEIFEDTANNSGLYLNVSDELKALGKSAMKSLFQRARINGSALHDVSKPGLETILNTCLPTAMGDALLRISNGKVRAVLGGNENGYSIIDMYEVFDSTAKYLTQEFKEVDFVSGTFTHEASVARWEVRDERIGDAYERALKDFKSNVGALITVADSDTGFSGANIYVSINAGNRKIYLSSPMKVEHEKNADISEFKENLKGILSLINDKMLDLNNLGKIEVEFPIPCIKHVMHKVGLGKKAVSEVTSLWEVMYGNDKASALDIYLAICEVPGFMVQKSKRTSEVSILDVEERVARISTLDFSEYDYKD